MNEHTTPGQLFQKKDIKMPKCKSKENLAPRSVQTTWLQEVQTKQKLRSGACCISLQEVIQSTYKQQTRVVDHSNKCTSLFLSLSARISKRNK